MTFSLAFLTSRTFWTAVLLGIYNLATVYGVLYPQAAWLPIVVNIVGTILITIFHVNPSQTYTPPAQS